MPVIRSVAITAKVVPPIASNATTPITALC